MIVRDLFCDTLLKMYAILVALSIIVGLFMLRVDHLFAMCLLVFIPAFFIPVMAFLYLLGRLFGD